MHAFHHINPGHLDSLPYFTQSPLCHHTTARTSSSLRIFTKSLLFTYILYINNIYTYIYFLASVYFIFLVPSLVYLILFSSVTLKYFSCLHSLEIHVHVWDHFSSVFHVDPFFGSELLQYFQGHLSRMPLFSRCQHPATVFHMFANVSNFNWKVLKTWHKCFECNSHQKRHIFYTKFY